MKSFLFFKKGAWAISRLGKYILFIFVILVGILWVGDAGRNSVDSVSDTTNYFDKELCKQYPNFEACQIPKNCDEEKDCSEQEKKDWVEYKKEKENENPSNNGGATSSLNTDIREYLEKESGRCSTKTSSQLSTEFKNKVKEVATSIGASETDLLRVIAFESGHKFCSCSLNPTSYAVGLIQFIPTTANDLGTSSKSLCDMSEIDQLDYVQKYLQSKRRNNAPLDSIEDLYMAVLWPRAVGESPNYVIFKNPSLTYSQNKGLDANGDGEITVAEASKTVYSTTTQYVN